MQIFRIENIELAPLTVIADDIDHAAELFKAALLTGFAMPPKVNFDVTAWNLKDGPVKDWFAKVSADGQSGIVWLADEDAPHNHPTTVIALSAANEEG